MLDLTVESNHVYTLMKCITQCFIKITLQALAESYIEKITGNKVQKQLSKHVHFEHQYLGGIYLFYLIQVWIEIERRRGGTIQPSI